MIINAERGRKLPNGAEAEKYFCRNEGKDALLLRELQMGLKTDQIVQRTGGIVAAQETRTNIGENIKDRYYELEDELSDPTKGGEYAFLNAVWCLL